MRLVAIGLLATLGIGSFGQASPVLEEATDDPLARTVPPDALAFLEIPDPGAIGPALLSSSTWQRFEAGRAWRAAVESEAWPKLVFGWRTLERIVGAEGLAALEALAGGGLALALLPPAAEASEPEWVLIARAEDPAVPQRLIDSASFLLRVIGWLGEGSGVQHPRLSNGGRALVVGEGFAFAQDATLIFASSLARIEESIARLRGSARSLAEEEDYRSVEYDECSVVRAFFRTGRLGRETRVVPERLDEPLVSLLAGGLLEAIGRSETVTLEARSSAGLVELVADVPVPPAALPGAQREAFPVEVTERPRLVPPPGTVLTLRARRDVARWWANRGELLDESVQRGFIELSNVMSLLFAGRDFGREVLPDFGTDWELIVARPALPEGAPRPMPLYPAVVLAAPLVDVDRWRVPLRSAFQTAIGIVNADRAQKGLGGLLIETGEHQGVPLQWASFSPDPEAGDRLPARFNASPASTILGDRFLLSSTEALLRQVVEANGEPAALEPTPWLELVLWTEPLVELLSDNREALVTNAVLNAGKLEERAELEVDVLLELLGLVERFELTTEAREDSWRVRLGGRLR